MNERERKLASIQKILSIEPIPEADAIEKATVLGWHLVVKKGEFQIGNWCIYCEIDSILPERPEFEFLRPRKFRIKTIKLRGQISQGICFPLSIIPPQVELNGQVIPTPTIKLEEGIDVTDLLGVKKYDPEEHVAACLRGKIKGNFPGFLRKTDEPRIQSNPGVLERNKGKKVYMTEKIDGTSATFFIKDGEYGVCSRKMWFKEDDEENRKMVYLQISEKLGLKERLIKANRNIAIQGEIVGPGVQKNKLGLAEHKLYVFNVWDIDKQCYLPYEEFTRFCDDLGLEMVPILGVFDLNYTVDRLVEMSNSTSVINPSIPREGIVIRSLFEEDDPRIGRLSFKCINPEFLLKYGD